MTPRAVRIAKYAEWRKLNPAKPRIRRTLAERFWPKVDTNGPVMRAEIGPCWVWLGGLNQNGYGTIGLGGREQGMVLAHRASWFLTRGEWPTLHICHRCDNPACVRATHLFEGTDLDNHIDKVRKGRQAYGAKYPHTKLSEEQVVAIRAEYNAGGTSNRLLGLKYGVSGGTISRIVTGVRRGSVQCA